MPADVAHIGQATESSATASNVRSPRTVLVRCAIARSENGAPVQGHVWLAMQPLLRTPVLCLKPLNGPIEFFFFKTLGTPDRDASGCGWHLVSKIKVHCKTDEFRSELIRLYPMTSPAIDQQLDDVAAAIRGFATQALAKSDFQHLLDSPDEMSRLELPNYPTQGSAQAPVLEVCPPLPVCPQESTLPQTQYFAVPDDLYVYRNDAPAADSPPAQGCGSGLASNVSPLAPASPQSAEERSEVYSSDEDEAEESPVSEGFVSRLSHQKLNVRRHAMYRRQGPQEQHLSHGVYVGPLCFNADTDTDDSGRDSPRSSSQDSQLSSTSDFDNSFIRGGY